MQKKLHLSSCLASLKMKFSKIPISKFIQCKSPTSEVLAFIVQIALFGLRTVVGNADPE